MGHRLAIGLAAAALLAVAAAHGDVSPVRQGGALVYTFAIKQPADPTHPVKATFTVPAEGVSSAMLRLTATNGDSRYRRSVHLGIDGVGDDISCTVAKNLTDGYIAPGKTRSWEFDLARRFRLFVRPTAHYTPARVPESTMRYLDTLNKGAKHSISCCISAPKGSENGSLVSLSLVVKPGKPAKTRTIAPKIESDLKADPRVSLAIDDLRDAVAGSTVSSFRYMVGKSVTASLVKPTELKGLGDQGFIVRTIGRQVVVTGPSAQGIAYGVHRLARIVRARPGSVASLNLRMSPAMPVREIYEEHGWADPGMLESYRILLRRYAQEGLTAFDLPVGWFLPPPYYLKGEPTVKPEDFATVRKVIEYAHSLGLKVYLTEDAYLNPLFQEKKENLRNIDVEKLDETQALTPAGTREPILLCLNNPVSRDILIRSREILYKALPGIDGILVYFGDPGGCYHPECLPHGKKIVQYMNEIYAPLVNRVCPGKEIVITLWGIGLDDTRYVVEHMSELPPNVVAMQVPPTSMEPGSYLTFEPARAGVIAQAAKSLPIVLQQFDEGVGFRNGWVDGWEHPMPRELEQSFRACYSPGSRVVGAYGSSFEMGHQFVDLRLGMEWAWNPKRTGTEILTEFGDEQFGPGVGPLFARAMYAMDDYWYRECKRFAYDVGGLADEELKEMRASLAKAETAARLLAKAEPMVTRGRLYYKGFTELAEMMACATRSQLSKEQATALADAGKREPALTAARSALLDSERVVEIATMSERYGWLTRHPWWSAWAIGKRPERMAGLVSEIQGTSKWAPIAIPDPSFEAQTWTAAGAGKFGYSGYAHSGSFSAQLEAIGADKWVAMNHPTPITVKPNQRYRVQFWAKVVSGTPQLYLDWSGSGQAAGEAVDGENADVNLKADGEWRRYTVDVTTPAMPAPADLGLRFVACGHSQVVLIDDVTVLGK